MPPRSAKDMVMWLKVAGRALALDPNGNGLGLFIAKGIIEGYGGRIWFTSEENKGTTIFFVINI